jgi:acetyltransferase-like isoleucine patch superfamily enzyme
MKFRDEVAARGSRVPGRLRRIVPGPVKRLGNSLYWWAYDGRDFAAEVVGRVPAHGLRLFFYRHLLKIQVGQKTSIHRNCRFYFPPGVKIGAHCIINRDVLLDGRMSLVIKDNVSISEGSAIITLEHDPDSPTFANRGQAVLVEDRVFIGMRALILPGVVLGEGSVVAAGAVVTRDVAPFQIVGGVPARVIGQRRQDLDYELDYRKFLG